MSVSAQQTAVIFGHVTDTGQQGIMNANITIAGLPGGTTTDKQGNFELQVPSGKKITVVITFVGFETSSIDLVLQPGERKEIRQTLVPASTALPSIDVKDRQIRTNTFNRIDIKTITLIPSANAGIEDLIKTMPGVSSHNELSSTYSVRGGNYDENLVFINDIEIYRPFLVRSGQQEGLSFLNPDLVSSIFFQPEDLMPVTEIKCRQSWISIINVLYHLQGHSTSACWVQMPTLKARSQKSSLISLGHGINRILIS